MLSYSESSFQATETRGASASFSFYGTQVTIYGAKRSNHGTYEVTLDGEATGAQNGFAMPDEFLRVLYSANVAKGPHNVTITNMENRWMDVDAVSGMDCRMGGGQS